MRSIQYQATQCIHPNKALNSTVSIMIRCYRGPCDLGSAHRTEVDMGRSGRGKVPKHGPHPTLWFPSPPPKASGGAPHSGRRRHRHRRHSRRSFPIPPPPPNPAWDPVGRPVLVSRPRLLRGSDEARRRRSGRERAMASLGRLKSTIFDREEKKM
jgi:hypothetical protein